MENKGENMSGENFREYWEGESGKSPEQRYEEKLSYAQEKIKQDYYFARSLAEGQFTKESLERGWQEFKRKYPNTSI